MNLNWYEPSKEGSAPAASDSKWSTITAVIFHWVAAASIFLLVAPMGLTQFGVWCIVGSYCVVPYGIALFSPAMDRKGRLRKACLVLGFLATPLIGGVIGLFLTIAGV